MKLRNAIQVALLSSLAACSLEATESDVLAPELASAALATLPTQPCMLDFNADDSMSGIEVVWAQTNLMTPADCARVGGATTEGIALPSSMLRIAAQAPSSSPGGITWPTGPTDPAILKYIVETGIPDGKYVPETHDCDDFAEEGEEAIEKVLPGAGTFTVLFCGALDGQGNFKNDKQNPISGHAITDVHLGSSVTWFEPQTGKNFDLDLDGDGNVSGEFSFPGTMRPTEKNGEYGCQVLIYGNRGEAEVDLGPLDEEPAPEPTPGLKIVDQMAKI
jgi:hypothetical protein